MKVIAYILALLVVVLTLMPCVDKPEGDALCKAQITQHHDQSSHEDDVDHCSPFCTCHCCQTSIYFPITPTFSAPVSMEFEHPSLQQKPVDNYVFEFYIPPRA